MGDDELKDYFDEFGQGAEQLSGVGVGAFSEGIESSLPEKLVEAAGGAGADLSLSPVGFALGILISELVKKWTITMPTAKKTRAIRDAIHSPLFSGGTLDKEIEKAAEKGKPEMLQRALNKVHAHYIKRLAQRHKKLVAAYNEIQALNVDPSAAATTSWPYTCSQAVDWVRYLLKVYHYSEKAYAHILFLLGAIDICENRMIALAASAGSSFDAS